MRIERIELENWMSYPRVWRDENGERCPAINLSGHPLILIAGENGAGKSAILEAICYALFAEYPRGRSNYEAIRSSQRKAVIRLYFSLPSADGDTTYRVERELSHTQTGQTQTGASLHKVDSDHCRELTQRDRVLIIDKQQHVTDYIRNKLLRGVDYATFVSSVFLRQQETGKFMSLAHGEQRMQLLSLCRLDIYDEIYSKAVECRKDTDRLIGLNQEAFSKVDYATNEKLQEQERLIEQIRLSHAAAEKMQANAKDIYDNARKAEELRRRIEDIRVRLLKWQEILKRKAEIEYAFTWQGAWDRVDSIIKRGRNIVELIVNQKTELSVTRKRCEALVQESQEVESRYDSFKRALEVLRDEYSRINQQITLLSQQETSLNQELQTAQSAKYLDEIIHRRQTEQAERRHELEKFDQTKQKYQLFNLLNQTKSVLDAVIGNLSRARNEEEEARKKRTIINQLKQDHNQKQILLEGKQAELITEEIQVKQICEEHNSIDRELTLLNDRLQARQLALHEGICPTCGLEMTGQIGSHVHNFAIQLQSEVGQRKEIQSIRIQMINKLNTEIMVRKDENHRFEKELVEITRQLDQAESDELQAKKLAAEFQHQASTQWNNHLDMWQEVSAPDCLKSPSIETQRQVDLMIGELSIIGREYEMLQQMRGEYESEQKNLQHDMERRSKINLKATEIDDLINQLQMDLRGCVDEKQKMQETQERLKGSGQDQKQKTDAAKKELETIKQKADQKVTEMRQLEVRLEQNQEQHQAIHRELLSEQVRLFSILPELANQLFTAVEDDQCFVALNNLARTYQLTALEVNELRKAELEAQNLEAVLYREQEELEVCSAIAGTVTSYQAEQNYKDAATHHQQMLNKLSGLDQELGIVRRDNHERNELKIKLDQAKGQKWAFEQIEFALKRGTKTQEAGPLMQQITNKLMHNISDEASRTLEKLGWHMGVEYDEKTGFQVKDRATSITRRYQEYSGGEQFAVAIAVALAVSRVTNKSSYIRCLFIDEGFGALDGKHRKRIVNDAIGMLIERGMRDQVVVITHIEDMQEYFPHRIELKRKDDYSVLVTE